MDKTFTVPRSNIKATPQPINEFLVEYPALRMQSEVSTFVPIFLLRSTLLRIRFSDSLPLPPMNYLSFDLFHFFITLCIYMTFTEVYLITYNFQVLTLYLKYSSYLYMVNIKYLNRYEGNSEEL